MFDHAVDTVGTAMAGVLVTQEVALAQHVALMVDQPMIPRLRGSKIKQMNAKKQKKSQPECLRSEVMQTWRISPIFKQFRRSPTSKPHVARFDFISSAKTRIVENGNQNRRQLSFKTWGNAPRLHNLGISKIPVRLVEYCIGYSYWRFSKTRYFG